MQFIQVHALKRLALVTSFKVVELLRDYFIVNLQKLQ